ncbi:MAG: hypothetical protein QM710_13165 [Flavobacterium sp.]
MAKTKSNSKMNLLSKFLLTCFVILAFSCNSKSHETEVDSEISPVGIISKTPKKFLFDASKAETAGNADWILDADRFPQRFPTPNQSSITSKTPETYWNGALSAWGIALVKLGHIVETLPTRSVITFGTNNPQDLKNYDVFVVDEPNVKFSDPEKTAILNFVKNGGGLFMISDHTGSDRNQDGFDSVEIWNDLMAENSVQQNPFGFSIDKNTFSEMTSNVLASNSNPVLNGSQGRVTQLKYSAGASITLNNPNAKGLIWRNRSSQGNSDVMCASSTFGKGRVVIIGDSSPADDGTGYKNDKLYFGWTELESHSRLHLNASLWLAKL